MVISKKNKILTIGIPVYNGDKYIKQRVQDILSVVDVDYQLIISDNCSNDNTQEICKKLQTEKNIIYFRQKKNIGVVENFKFLINQCKTKYFVFASVDDYWSDKFINDSIQLLEKNNASIAFSNFFISDKNTSKKIPIYVTPSVSNSPFIRMLTRILDPAPHIIYGVINLSFYDKNMLKNMDFFDIYFTFAMSIKSKIIISNDFNFYWQIDNQRKSYSIFGKKVSVLKFFFNSISLTKSFSLMKKLFILILLVKWSLSNFILRIFKPKYFDIKF